ncbi:MFS transporter [Marinomonas mediterranea]|jgi:Nucleoside H+ symporter.|uniref:Major facilitator superfamily MFS_1 n=1 Tax=Marinomonas mediterranea (strain ATCC 700492 / JCM 21426 / NBRC 103028 / MMB-1) TaxID=717774 RepID=F2JTK5_MARM1|nr:MFS transporter [Marinomonas mediterranea]ADZ91519.1 major facilitator superfamily MFS_1 [Marinomonas mediterranea MMB-1]WCN09484.1 MFS transporter [Marinomonas mediterranea]WCN17626.1 MFS transporter [Marinomonas mediterranea MMB-1]
MFDKRSLPIAVPLFSYFFFYCAAIGILMPYMSIYYSSIGLNGSQIGRLMSTFTLASIMVPHFWGWLTTKFGLPKKVMQICMLGTILSFFPFNFTDQFDTLFILTCVMAMFYSALMPLADGLAVMSIQNTRIPYTRIRVGGSIGYIVSVSLIGFAIKAFGVGVVVPSICVCLVLAFITSLFIKEKPYKVSSAHTEGNFKELLFRKEVALFFGLAFLSYMAHAPFNIFFAVHLSDVGYSGAKIGLLLGFGVAIEVLLFLYCGHFVQRYYAIHLLLLCFVCGVIRWALLAWFASSVWVVLFTQLMHCITFALFHMVSIDQVRRLFPDRFGSQGQSTYSAFAVGLGSGVGMIFAGYSWDLIGGNWTFTVSSFMSVAAIVLLIRSQKE